MDFDKAITELKREPDYAWLKQASGVVITQTLKDLDQAYVNAFRRLREGKKPGFPRFKKRHQKQSVRYRLNHRSGLKAVSEQFVKLPKLGEIKVNWTRPMPGTPKMATVSKDPTGRYFISMGIEQDAPELPMTQRAVGVDVGIKDVFVTSEGYKSGAPRHYYALARQLEIAQRRLSRKDEGSGRYRDQQLKVAKLYGKVANARREWLHQETTAIVERFDVIAVEDLNIRGMSANRRLSKAVQDASLGEALRQLEYKAHDAGKRLIRCDRFDPTSKVCHQCGHYHRDLKLSDRDFDCHGCGEPIDRDVNAAKNVLLYATAKLGGIALPAPGENTRVEPDNPRWDVSRWLAVKREVLNSWGETDGIGRAA